MGLGQFETAAMEEEEGEEEEAVEVEYEAEEDRWNRDRFERNNRVELPRNRARCRR